MNIWLCQRVEQIFFFSFSAQFHKPLGGIFSRSVVFQFWRFFLRKEATLSPPHHCIFAQREKEFLRTISSFSPSGKSKEEEANKPSSFRQSTLLPFPSKMTLLLLLLTSFLSLLLPTTVYTHAAPIPRRRKKGAKITYLFHNTLFHTRLGHIPSVCFKKTCLLRYYLAIFFTLSFSCWQ